MIRNFARKVKKQKGINNKIIKSPGGASRRQNNLKAVIS
jgi:hypothetical protein